MKPRFVPAALTVSLVAGAVALIAGRAWGRRFGRADEPRTAAAEPALDPWTPPADVVRPALFYDRFETIGRADGLPSDRVTSVLAQGDLLAVGTDDGLAVRRGGVWRVWREKDGLAHRHLTSIAR